LWEETDVINLAAWPAVPLKRAKNHAKITKNDKNIFDAVFKNGPNFSTKFEVLNDFFKRRAS